jgi:hypothetical protein
MTEQRNTRAFTAVYILLLLAACGLAFFFWRKSDNAGMENNRQAAELQALELEKSMVERELDSLTISYLNIRQENEDLRGKESASTELVNQKEAAIRKIKAQNRRDLQALRKQVEELRRIKIEYETVIATVRSENEQLREENRVLTGENVQLRDENSSLSGQMQGLAKQLEEQIRKTQSARFKASSFRVEVARKSDKLTARAKKARGIFVSFDLADVPEPYRGPQKLYLVVTDDKGRPVFSDNPVKTTVQAPTGPVAITYQQVKQVMINDTQRLSFTFNLDERLRAGGYVVAIYCDAGLLGASSFRLA